jgi:hypothetical protein
MFGNISAQVVEKYKAKHDASSLACGAALSRCACTLGA